MDLSPAGRRHEFQVLVLVSNSKHVLTISAANVAISGGDLLCGTRSIVIYDGKRRLMHVVTLGGDPNLTISQNVGWLLI